MEQTLGEINRKISTQFKLPELAEKETKQLIPRNKKSEIEKHIQTCTIKFREIKSI